MLSSSERFASRSIFRSSRTAAASSVCFFLTFISAVYSFLMCLSLSLYLEFLILYFLADGIEFAVVADVLRCSLYLAICIFACSVSSLDCLTCRLSSSIPLLILSMRVWSPATSSSRSCTSVGSTPLSCLSRLF